MDIQLYFTVQSTTIGSLIVLHESTTLAIPSVLDNTRLAESTTSKSDVSVVLGISSSPPLPLTKTSESENICGIYQLQSSQSNFFNPNDQVPTTVFPPRKSPKQQNGFYSPFNEFSVKLAMLDQVDNYIYSPLAELFHNYTDVAHNYPKVTPNMISALGVIFASAAAYLVFRGKRYHRLAVMVFQVRSITPIFKLPANVFHVFFSHVSTLARVPDHICSLLDDQLRIFCDAVDGLVARKRMGIGIQVSVRSTSGFYADAIADTLGVAVFLFACWIYLRRIERRIVYVPLKSFNESIDVEAKGDVPGLNDHLESIRQYKGQRRSVNNSKGASYGECLYVKAFEALCGLVSIVYKLIISSTCKLLAKLTCRNTWQLDLTVACFAIQLLTTGIFWNYFIEQYHLLLESPSYSMEELTRKNVVFHSSLTWTIMWFWKISCGHSLTNMLLVSIYFHKLHPFLKWIQWIGLFVLLILGFFTTLHIQHALNYVCG